MAEKITVYQKPTCSKCIATLALLDERSVAYEAINYYEQPLTVDEFQSLLDKLGKSPREVLRADEALARELKLAEGNITDDELIRVMIEHPDLIQRPIVVAGEKAVLGRPIENVEKLL